MAFRFCGQRKRPGSFGAQEPAAQFWEQQRELPRKVRGPGREKLVGSGCHLFLYLLVLSLEIRREMLHRDSSMGSATVLNEAMRSGKPSHPGAGLVLLCGGPSPTPMAVILLGEALTSGWTHEAKRATGYRSFTGDPVDLVTLLVGFSGEPKKSRAST